MKILSSLLFLMILCCCKSKKENNPSTIPPAAHSMGTDTAGNFFPVTTYIKGEIRELKNTGETLLKTTSAKGITDTSWLKYTELDSAFADVVFKSVSPVFFSSLISPLI